MDHNILNVMRVIYLDFAFCARPLISRGIISRARFIPRWSQVIRVNLLETVKARTREPALDSKASPANEL